MEEQASYTIDKVIEDGISDGTMVKQEQLTGPVSSWIWPRIVGFIPLMQALPHGDEIFPYFWRIAQTGLPLLSLGYGFADRIRNVAARRFLHNTDYTHLLMLDWDHKHPPDLVHRLAHWVLEDPDRLIVGGLNFKRAEPFTPCMTMAVEGGYASPLEWNTNGGALQKVTGAIGFGSVLIAREAFERIPEPWFMHDWRNAGEDPGYIWPGHDVYFCRKAQEAGVPIYCDMSLTSLHAGKVQWIGPKTFETYQKINPTPQAEVIHYD